MKVNRSNIIIGVSLTLLFIIIIRGCINRERLKEIGVLVTVQVVDYKFMPKGMNFIKCEFKFNDQLLVINANTSISAKKWKRLKGHFFPAVYSPKLGMLKILISAEDFEDFNMPYPDSLAKWASDNL
ncbi:hypothetical protein LQ567_14115 [Niabella pedocola]|uniref:Lipoprotein n=1 Tax=Niabella pedocola TaxID=1752077 RepID=A0ABS8PUF7_9BACT|nr:hypothetical protein [Niabella pedocola]MCD2423908.1 hypothetical protein [Niabella pedocola]